MRTAATVFEGKGGRGQQPATDRASIRMSGRTIRAMAVLCAHPLLRGATRPPLLSTSCPASASAWRPGPLWIKATAAAYPQKRVSELAARGPVSPHRPPAVLLPSTRAVPMSATTASGSGGGGVKSADREILVQHLLVGADQVQLLIDIQRGVAQEGLDLSVLAEEYSECPSRERGGMLGWIRRGQTDPAFEEAAFSAPLNKLVRAKSKHGLHLLQVLNERQPRFLEQIQVELLHERMQEPDFLDRAQLIDVREPGEISTAAIPGFEAYPLSQFGNWAPNIADDLDPEVDTYVLCHHGMRSMQAANWLQSQGFARLYNVAGGIHAYSSRVDNSIPTY